MAPGLVHTVVRAGRLAGKRTETVKCKRCRLMSGKNGFFSAVKRNYPGKRLLSGVVRSI
jgi:hypothetical protein